ncbi:hypothetical protein LCGC14_2158620 [marine sediment metagenome]|uniref:Rubredoxin-like domain-containing protein n=1 Tax=marine sediment metagenome TaxID=412755 RepID=A0A0F9G696_9ZZZZ
MEHLSREKVIRLYKEWLCTGCGDTWKWTRAKGKPPHCPTCEPEKGLLPRERLPAGTKVVDIMTLGKEGK